MRGTPRKEASGPRAPKGRPPWRRRQGGFALACAVFVAVFSPSPSWPQESTTPATDWRPPAPFRIRDLTLPNALVLGLIPVPPETVGRGSWAVELIYSHSNTFQVSDGVEEYLRRRDRREPLSPADVVAILSEFGDDVFYIDGEFGLANFSAHYGLTQDLDVFVNIPYFIFTGGFFDGVIEGFHDALGVSQAGRDLVARNQFQILIPYEGGNVALLDRPSSGGFGDPVVGARYAWPVSRKGWRVGLEAAAKIPVAQSGKFLSSGSADYGVQLALGRTWRKNALVINASYVITGDFDGAPGFEPAILPALNLAYLHRLGARSTLVLQSLTAGSIFSDTTDSSLSDLEFQTTIGVKWKLRNGYVGIAVTENLFNYDNTPDIAAHVSFAFILE